MGMRRMAILAVAGIVLAGCGGSDKDPDARATPTPEGSEVPVHRITEARAKLVRTRMSKARVIELLGGEPLLRQRPTKFFPQGCFFYPVEDLPLANMWQYCFDGRGVKLVLSAYSPQQPAPPAEASPQRAALIARADSVCASLNSRLTPTGTAVAQALDAFAARPGHRLIRAEIDRQLKRFVAIIEDLEAQLSAFETPPDARESFDAYAGGLAEQARVLEQARVAFKAGRMEAYDALGQEFTQIGEDAKRDAKEYGFAQCSASTFG